MSHIRFLILPHVLLTMSSVSCSFEIFTKDLVTAVRGNDISIPCNFSGNPTAVYWYRHNSSGAPNSIATLVAQDFQGEDIIKGGFRYNITDDHSLVIKNVSVQDETTYSCLVVLDSDEDNRGYTNLTVLALAEPLEPVIISCEVTEPGQCIYTLANDIPEQTKLVCTLENVRPQADLKWKSHDGSVLKAFETRITEISGLFKVSADLQVFKYDYDSPFKCEATGEAVRGTSSMTVKITKAKDQRSEVVPVIVSFFVLVIVIAVIIVIVFLWKKYFFQSVKNNGDPPETHGDPPESDVELQPFNPIERIAVLRRKILDYTPGGLTDCVLKKGCELPDHIRIAVVGTMSAGKSSLIRSLIYALTGKYSEEIEISGTLTGGTMTSAATFYKITESIHIQDNQGLRDLDTEHVPGIMQEVGNERISLLVPVFRAEMSVMIEQISNILRELTADIRDTFASYPLVILTHRDKAGDESAQNTTLSKVASMGARDENIKFIENFTKEPTNESECLELIKEFLELLLSMLTFADKNLVHQLNKGKLFREDRNDLEKETNGTSSQMELPVSRWKKVKSFFT